MRSQGSLESVPTVEGGWTAQAGVVLRPAMGWTVALKLAAMTGAGALATPCVFLLFDYLNHVLNYTAAAPLSFRPDREIVRGRR